MKLKLNRHPLKNRSYHKMSFIILNETTTDAIQTHYQYPVHQRNEQTLSPFIHL
jgi:hypothetical protein